MTVESSEPGLTIGDVAARTGVSVTTLRAWEMRYGFPVPTRLASGHRRYRIEDVATIEQLERDRAGGLSLAAAMARARREAAASAPSIFAGLRARYPDLVFHVLGKRAMYAMSRAIEDECLAAGGDAVVIGSFQRERFYRGSERRWRDLARTADRGHRPRRVLRRATPVGPALEIVDPAGVGPHPRMGDRVRRTARGRRPRRLGAAATSPGRRTCRRRFEAIWSTDAEVVREATRDRSRARRGAQQPAAAGQPGRPPARRGRPRGRAAPHDRTDQPRRGVPRMTRHRAAPRGARRPGRRPRPPGRHRAEGVGPPPRHAAPPRLLVPRRRLGGARAPDPPGRRQADLAGHLVERVLRPPAARRDPARGGRATAGRGARSPRRGGSASPSPTSPTGPSMDDGTTEHELCPVLVAEVDGEPSPNHAEVDAVRWVGWDELRRRADAEPHSLEPVVGAPDRRAGRAGAVAPPVARAQPAHGGPPRPPGGTAVRPRRRPACSIEQALARRPWARRGALARLRARPPRCCSAPPTPAVGEHRRRGAAGSSSGAASGCAPPSCTGATPPPGRPADDRVVTVAAAVELLHTFALLHDDVMDRSATRRGAPAAHVTLAAARPGPSGHPDAGWFGTSAAILAGDLAFLWADELLDAAGAGAATMRGPRPSSTACAPR